MVALLPEDTYMLRFFVVLSMLSGPVVASNLQVGDKAPEFKLPGSDGQDYALDQFLGKKGVVIAWFPKAFTGG
jgi:peroxiredoxin Q/BCP